jgi:hypothetical protein
VSKTLKIVGDDISDGFHTFDELYEHRITLWIALCRWIQAESNRGYAKVWRSKLHSDGSCFDGWFVLGQGVNPGEQITYHVPLSRWDETRFAPELERAPDWDGHTPADVLKRLAVL